MTEQEKLTKSVTPAVLEDFYNEKIALFLNPAIQHFNKSDIYSLDEKIIGQWYDKKPLYQKTIDFGALPNNTTKKVAHGINNLAEVCHVFGTTYAKIGENEYYRFLPIISPNTQAGYIIDVYIHDNDICIDSNHDYSSYKKTYITLQYTKTTDSPLNYTIGNPYDYSLDERLIGTWIDGKPVYQKSFIATSPTKADTITVIVQDDFSYIDQIINMSGNIAGRMPLNVDYSGASGTYASTFLNSAKTGIVQYVGNPMLNRSVLITLLYTKTS